MTSLLKGVGFITGAASGIGKATAYSFVRHGVTRIVISDLNAEAAQRTASEIQQDHKGVEAFAIQTNVVDEASINEAISKTVERFGRIDYAVNNAGIGGSTNLSADHELAEWKKTIDVDLTGVWLSSRAEIRQMLKQESSSPGSKRHHRGVIINIASMYGIVATNLNTPVISYTAAKHGVIGLTRSDAITYAPQGIRINAMCPGYVATPLLQSSAASGVMDKEVKKVPMGRLADMDEIADHITFLASPLSSYMCGSALVADGGFTVQ